ncbi:MAG TPA: 4-hydroxyphenylacetate 3-hydroxylase N-terminal domain-containing protein [Thermomicrobiales bacterium]|nr:4-hydroxyphenylacetate 3-hydroxylase N-terminal domain-containing protein [Thermomicrobiales bacterium]
MGEAATRDPATRDETDRLLDGAEYLASLRDAREVYIYGERVRDVTTHPAFRNAARSIARLYDALHDPATRDVLTAVDDYGIRTHKFFKPSRTAQELLEAREAIAAWSRLSYGFMGRTPDYKASFMAALGAAPDFYAPFDANALAWYKKYAARGLFLNHVLVNPPIDRKKPVHEVADVFVHVERETDGGIVVSGAKMLATGSALTHATFVAQNSATQLEPGKAEDFALVFIIPIDTPNAKLLCRASYEQGAHSPFDYPLSSRFDENDAVLVLDRAFIPWENVLVYRDIEKATAFYAASGFLNRFNFQSGTRLGVKLDLMTGLFARGMAANGTDAFRGVQVALGDIIGWRNLIWALTTAMALDPQPGPGDSVVPKLEHAAALRLFATQAWPAIKETFETVLGGSPLVTPSSYKDLQNPELRPLIDRYYRGSDSSAEERIKLFKLIWDAIGTEFGARHELYERNYSGNNEQIRLDLVGFARRRGIMDACLGLVDQCMSDYDLDGWTSATWED